MIKCNKDCFNCIYEDCILDEKPAQDRREYHRQYYLNSKKPKTCFWCGKELHGEVIRMSKHNYCDINCVLCQLYKENEHKLTLKEV